MKANHYELEGKKIVVVDDAITINELHKLLFLTSSISLQRQGYTNAADSTTTHYIGNLALDKIEGASFFKKIQDVVTKESGFSAIKCLRIIYREMVYGDHFEYHTDSTKEGHLTVLIYLNEDWHENNRGETLFSDSQGLGISVQPRPGRLILFDARLSHTSSAPARTFFQARKILVFNFVKS